MDSPAILLTVLLVWPTLLTFLYIRGRGSTFRNLRGPEPSTFWLGCEADLRYQNEVGDCEFKWMREYGGAWRRTGCFGRDHLMLADPKAIQHVLHKSGYHYDKSVPKAHFNELVVGKGILSVCGETHHRQRKVISPAFNAPQLRSFLPVFHKTALKLVQKWNDEVIASDPSGQPLIDLVVWLSRTTLDIMGEVGCDYQFGCLDNIKASLAEQYDDLFVDSTLYPRGYDLIFKESWHFIPEPLLDYVRYVPAREYSRFRYFLDYVRNFAGRLVKESKNNDDEKNFMNMLLRANESLDPKDRLTNSEAIDEIATLLMAGDVNITSSLSWFFFEVAKYPESQERIRQEIAAVRARSTSEQYTTADLDGMKYTQAALKESLRLHPILWTLDRKANKDDVIPLAFPITTKSGEQITSIPIKKGTPIDISTAAYNRFPGIWGDDADEWNPERFLDQSKARASNVGMLSNLMNFASGSRSCLGWRFSVLEMQIIIITLLENFEFSLPPQDERTEIHRKPAAVMIPMAKGHKGPWMGLLVKPVN